MTKTPSLQMHPREMDFHTSGLWNWLELDMRVSGKNLGEDRLKIAGCTAIALFEALSEA